MAIGVKTERAAPVAFAAELGRLTGLHLFGAVAWQTEGVFRLVVQAAVTVTLSCIFTNPGPKRTQQKARCKLEKLSQDDVVSWACLRLSLDCFGTL